MASDAIGILISAEDQASAKIAQAAANIDRSVKKIKDVGGKAKASTEFIGQLANQLGGTAIGNYAGQLAGLTEKISQFAEVSKAGSAGALAFKAGLVGAVAVLSVNVGKSIGDWYFETQKWNDELDRSIALSAKLSQKLNDLKTQEIRDELARISLNPDLDEQAAQIQVLIDKERERYNDIVDNVDGTIAKKEEEKKKLEALFNLSNAMKDLGVNIIDNPDLRAKEKEIEIEKQQAEAIKKTIDELERKIGFERELAIEANEKSVIRNLEQELALLKANEEEARKLKAEYAGLTGEAAARAVELMKEADAEKQLKEEAKKAEEERKKAFEQEQAARKRLIDLLANENQKLQERAIAIEKGSEAARAFALESQGVTKAEAERIAAREEELNRMERSKQVEQNRKEQNPALQASQSRTLMRGSGEGFQVKIADSTRKTVDILAEIRVLQRELITATKEKKPTEIKLEQR